MKQLELARSSCWLVLVLSVGFVCHWTNANEDRAEIGSDCDQIAVAKCFIYLLDDWAWNLWAIKQSIEALNSTSCDVHAQMKSCVDFQGCSRPETIEISKVVTDLLHHSKDSGTFLRSFFAVEFACQPQGQQILAKNQACLREYHFGEQLLQEIKLFNRQLKRMQHEHDLSNACSELENVANKFEELTSTACGGDAAAGTLICKSIANPFREIYPAIFQDCDDPCAIGGTGFLDDEEPQEPGQESAYHPPAHNGEAEPHQRAEDETIRTPTKGGPPFGGTFIENVLKTLFCLLFAALLR